MSDTANDPRPGEARPDFAAWAGALEYAARHFSLNHPGGAASRLAATLDGARIETGVGAMARRLGLEIRWVKPEGFAFDGWRLPAIARFHDGSLVMIRTLGGDARVEVVFTDDETRLVVPADDVLREIACIAIPRPSRGLPDARVDGYLAPHERGWFRRLALADFGAYGHVLVASLAANVLALAGVVFSMQVYDRVVPANSTNTLYVLFAGVLIAIGFDFVLKRVRARIVDVIGKRTDMRMSDLVFGHALRVKNAKRPASTGTFIAQLRDLEQVRELLTSTTVAAIADLPFFLLFLAVFWIIGGPLAAIPIAALVLLLVPGIAMQPMLKAAANEGTRESSLRNAMLIEAVQGLEDIKMLGAEDRFQGRWNGYNAAAADAQLRLRSLTNTLQAWSGSIQTATFAVIVFVGAPLVMAGDMTTGALVGCSILGSRMMAPMAQLTGVLGRLQQARVGFASLDAIMQMPVDYPERETRITRDRFAGGYALKSATFHYGDTAARPALVVRDLSIAPGERIAVLGRNGAGKSTLLQALAGMIEPSEGEILLDDLALGHLDPGDVRRDVGLVTQNSRLFHGTIRENLLLGAPGASQEAVLDALALVGADEFVKRLPKGLDHPILEGGRGLSGGQQQALILARMFIRDPAVVLLDEPTAAMDEATERRFIHTFATWSAGRTVVVATHRMRVLDLVDRILVFEGGQLTLDKPKDAALKTLRGVSPVVAATRPTKVPQ